MERVKGSSLKKRKVWDREPAGAGAGACLVVNLRVNRMPGWMKNKTWTSNRELLEGYRDSRLTECWAYGTI